MSLATGNLLSYPQKHTFHHGINTSSFSPKTQSSVSNKKNAPLAPSSRTPKIYQPQPFRSPTFAEISKIVKTVTSGPTPRFPLHEVN